MSRPSDMHPNGERSPDILREFAGLLTDVSDLVDSIETLEAPHDLSDFVTIPVVGESIVIPEQVQRTIGDVQTIVLFFDIPASDSDSTIQHASSLGIELIGKDKTYTLSRTSEDTSELNDYIFDIEPISPDARATFGKTALKALRHDEESTDDFLKNIETVEAIDRKDLNALLMSIAFPDNERGYDMFESANLLDKDVLEKLRESVQFGLVSNHTGLGYVFNSTDASITYFRQENQPISFQISYPDYKHGRAILAQHTLETDFTIAFSTIETLPGLNNDSVDGTVDFIPSVNDLMDLRSILQTETMLLNATHGAESPLDVAEIEEVDEINVDPAVQFDKSGQDYFSPQFTQDTLDGLNFEPSDLDE